MGPLVVGNAGELVDPVTYALPDASTPTPSPISVPVPPRYVQYRSCAPVVVPGLIFATNASIGATPVVGQLVPAVCVGTSRQAPPGVIALRIGKSVVALFPV